MADLIKQVQVGETTYDIGVDSTNIVGNLVTSVNGETGDVTALTIDLTDADQGIANLTNADTLGGYMASNYVRKAELQEENAQSFKYCSFSIATSDWVLNDSTSVYEYVLSKSAITSDMALIELNLDSTSQTYQKTQLNWTTSDGAVTFSTSVQPTGTINGYFIATRVVVI